MCGVVFFVAERHEHLKGRVALVDPVVRGIGLDAFPFLLTVDAVDALETLDDGQIFLASEVISNVVVVEFGLSDLGGVLDKERDGNAGLRGHPVS